MVSFGGAAVLKSSAVAPRCTVHTDFQKVISHSLLVGIVHVICRGKLFRRPLIWYAIFYTKIPQIFFEFSHKLTLSVFMLKTCLQNWYFICKPTKLRKQIKYNKYLRKAYPIKPKDSMNECVKYTLIAPPNLNGCLSLSNK